MRTAIDSRRRRADQGKAEAGLEPEGKLFAWEMIHPFTRDGKPVVWRSRVDLAGIDEPDRAMVAEQLGGLLRVLSFVSKTKAACEVTVTPIDPAPAASPDSDGPGLPDPSVAIVLQTPALLCDPRFQDLAGVPKSGALGLDDLHRLYAAVWESREFAEGALELSHFFASQSLAGGEYLHHRFRQGRPYNPWLLTDAGSVFVFSVKDAVKARGLLDTWVHRGLPLPAWAVNAWGGGWRTNPFLPENGFGEIAVHTPHPAAPVPEPSQIEYLGSIGSEKNRAREQAPSAEARQAT